MGAALMPRGRPGKLVHDGPTAADRARALAGVDERMRVLREQISRAALRCLRQHPDAAVQVRAALELVDQARHLLAVAGSEGEA
jgi:hypothetical protein